MARAPRRVACSGAVVIALALAMTTASCGRVGFDPRVFQDGGADAPYQTLEMVAVPADGTVVNSTVVLQLGVTYRLRASGIINVGGSPDPRGDAEYWNFNAGPMDLATNGLVDAGLAVDDPTVGMTKTPLSWGPYDPTHVYEVPWPGTGATISANYHDDFPSNNSGTLTLEILGP
jgi:hypothetical protein